MVNIRRCATCLSRAWADEAGASRDRPATERFLRPAPQWRSRNRILRKRPSWFNPPSKFSRVPWRLSHSGGFLGRMGSHRPDDGIAYRVALLSTSARDTKRIIREHIGF